MDNGKEERIGLFYSDGSEESIDFLAHLFAGDYDDYINTILEYE